MPSLLKGVWFFGLMVCSTAFVTLPAALRFGSALSLGGLSQPPVRFSSTFGRRPGSIRRGGVLGVRSELNTNFEKRSLVKDVKSLDEFEELIGDKLVVVKLAASFCRKCHALQGKYLHIAKMFQSEDIVFAKVTLDKVVGVSQRTEVKYTPTFQVGGDQNETVEKLNNLVKQWADGPGTMALNSQEKEASEIVQEYTPKRDVKEAAPALKSSQPEMASHLSAPADDSECGEEGCEIVWD